MTSPRARRRWPLVAALAAIAVPAAAGAWMWTISARAAPAALARGSRRRASAAPPPAPPAPGRAVTPPVTPAPPAPAPPPAPPAASSRRRASRHHDREDPAALDRQTLMRVLGRRDRRNHRGGTCTRAVRTGSIWSPRHAERRCARVCEREGGQWDGRWNSVIPGQSATCTCRFQGAACR
ncbi:MAG: mannan-binding protein [Polyangiales bacterium]